MTITDIKKQLVNLPHVKKVWVKGSDYSLVKLHGWDEVDLEQEPVQEQEQEPVQEQIQKPSKKR